MNFLSPLVFDPIFYINDNPDLQRAGIDTENEANHHWLTTGAREGRQGCGSFHSMQYLQRFDPFRYTIVCICQLLSSRLLLLID